MNFDKLKELCRLSRIKWSKHALERMQERNIRRDDVKNCIMHGEIHVVVSCNGENVGLITAYFPD